MLNNSHHNPYMMNLNQGGLSGLTTQSGLNTRIDPIQQQINTLQQLNSLTQPSIANLLGNNNLNNSLLNQTFGLQQQMGNQMGNQINQLLNPMNQMNQNLQQMNQNLNHLQMNNNQMYPNQMGQFNPMNQATNMFPMYIDSNKNMNNIQVVKEKESKRVKTNIKSNPIKEEPKATKEESSQEEVSEVEVVILNALFILCGESCRI